MGTVHNRLESAAVKAAEINQAQELSTIKQGLHDEIFQGSLPVLAGVDAVSTYCYLLKAAEHRDEDTWGWYLLELQAQLIRYSPIPSNHFTFEVLPNSSPETATVISAAA